MITPNGYLRTTYTASSWSSVSTLYAYFVDDIAPETPKIENPTNGNWTNQSFKLKLSSSDAGSGIAYYQYSYDNSTWTTYSNSASTSYTTTAFSAERNQLVYIRCADKAGNVSGVASTYIRIDKTPPTTSGNVFYAYIPSLNSVNVSSTIDMSFGTSSLVRFSSW